MNKLITLAALTSTLLASGLAQAATTTELKVTGVIRPAACTPSFTGGGTVDYGVIPPNTLSATAPTALTPKDIPFSVTCDAAAKVAVRVTDNRKTSVVAGAVATMDSTYNDSFAFGLGTVGGKNVGAYVVGMLIGGITADGTTPDLLQDNASNGSVWTKVTAATGLLFANNGGLRQSFATPGTLVPGAYKAISGSFRVKVVIDKTSNLNLTADVPLDGSATVEVMYL